jgi:uncharacterized membrane protein
VEIEEALAALIVEKLDDGSYTVLVPSAPTPMAGSIYILPRDRVHPVDIPLTKAIRRILEVRYRCRRVRASDEAIHRPAKLSYGEGDGCFLRMTEICIALALMWR